MRFGAFVPQGWRLDLVGIDRADHWPTMLSVARTIERAGYESLWVFDHFHTVPVPTQEVTYEAWTLMGALAATTDSVRLGQMCTANSYRSPSYLAKVAATVDVFSGGRLDMGIGAGWYQHEFEGYGYEFARPAVRIAQLGEAVEIMRRMWTEDEVYFEGTYYTLRGAICQPKPVQTPHIPVWVAGGGEKLTLNVAARYASYTNFGSSVDEFAHKSEVLRGHCDDVGRDFVEITRSSNFTLLCGEDEKAAGERLEWFRAHFAPFVDPDSAVERWNVVAGTPEQLAEMFGTWATAGLGYSIVNFPDAAYDSTGLELFGREVIPALTE